MTDAVLYEVRDNVALITLNRPERLNAWNADLATGYFDSLDQAAADPAVGAIVVTGAGRGFCAGADMTEVFQAQLDGDEEDRTPLDWVGLIRSSKPIIAAINGPAIGVGLSQVMTMDHIVGAAGAKISLRFVKIGVVPELASSHLVPMRVGFGKASELMLTGKTILAEEAAEIGLIDRVVEPTELMAAAYEMARAMGENPQASLRFTKQLLTENMSERSLTEVQRLELKLLNQAYSEPEHKEAIAAFLEKREPDFLSARKNS